MKKHLILPAVLIMFALGCATGVAPRKTQLQIREIQTRTFETNDTKMVMKAMLNVLQDEGFIVKNAVLDLGLLSAEKAVDIEDKGEAFMMVFLAGPEAKWNKASIIECTANVSEFGEKIRVRVNFQLKVLDNKGGIVKIEQIDDEKYYRDFFSKVDKGIFLQREKI